jgi:LPXTG-motif cell wall-anchored protein
MLPETGAGGTVLFITIGAILLLGAGVILVTKKRMSMIQD